MIRRKGVLSSSNRRSIAPPNHNTRETVIPIAAPSPRIMGMAVKNARGPETNARTATVGRYVKMKRAIVTQTVKTVDATRAGSTGLMSVGCVTK